MKTATVISSHETSAVNIGSIVTVEKDGKKFTYTIVGSEEANVIANKISIKSPFGQAILGKKKSEAFTFTSPNGQLSYKVVDIK